MQRARIDGADLAYDVVGSGDPVLLIHGSVLADAFCPLLAEPGLADRYRMITYHRRGYGRSSRATPPLPIARQAADARSLLAHLSVERAHVVGHSYGGAIATQLTLDAPDLVASLALLEPAFVLLPDVPSGPSFEGVVRALRARHLEGDGIGAIDAFLAGVMGPGYQSVLAAVLPAGAFDMAVADGGTLFEVEIEALATWRFTSEDAARIRQPVLSVVGEQSDPIFHEIWSLLARWMPEADQLTIPRATHALQMMNPGAVAAGLAGFLGRHRL